MHFKSCQTREWKKEIMSVSSLNKACDAAVALTKEDWQDRAIYLTPPRDNDDTPWALLEKKQTHIIFPEICLRLS